MHDVLKSALAELSEEDLTALVIRPLVEKLRKGRVEYTHSSIEAGRDVVSFSVDDLGRLDVLCIQVKAARISYAPDPFIALYRVAEAARKLNTEDD